MRGLLLLTLAGLVGTSAGPRARATPAARTALPFHVGERLTYDAHVSFIHAGSATMSIDDIQEIRGHTTYHSIFDIHGHVLWFHVNDHSESWFDPTTMISYHQVQHVAESRYNADRVYDF